MFGINELTPFLNLMIILGIVYIVIILSTKFIRLLLGLIILVSTTIYILGPNDVKNNMDNFAKEYIIKIKNNNLDPSNTLNLIKDNMNNIIENSKKTIQKQVEKAQKENK